jgi:linoleoyl-CoA desaturase
MSKTTRVAFSNQQSPFFEALKSRVDAYFDEQKIRPSGNFRLYGKAIFLICITVATYIGLVFGNLPVWASVCLCVLMGFNLAAIGFNVMHDGAHGSFSRKTWVNNLMANSLDAMGGSSTMWKIKHNFNHHTYTNIDGLDDDIDIRPFLRINEDQTKHWFHRFQHYYFVLLYALTYLLWVFILDFKKYFSGKVADLPFRKFTLKQHLLFWGAKTFYFSVFLLIPAFRVGVVETIVGYLLVCLVCGLIISIVFQLAHVVEGPQFPVPDDKRKIKTEWAVHQLLTTANFATRSRIISWFVGGLNFQVEHHLFPRISHIHYPAINKLVKDTCAEFSVAYFEFPTLGSAIKSHVVHLKKVGKAA